MKAAEQYRQLHIRRDKRRLMTALRAEANRLSAESNAITEALKKAVPSSDIAVTDHAVVRFMERVMGIDVDAIRAQIARLVPKGAAPIPTPQAPDNHGVLLVEDYQFLLTPRSLITVLDEEMSADCWLGLQSREEIVA